MQRLACRTWALTVTMLFASCISAVAQEFAAREKLRAQSNEFRKEVIRVTDGVYVAVGYSASNVILIQGDRGSIVVDTSADPVEARAIRTAFGDLRAADQRHRPELLPVLGHLPVAGSSTPVSDRSQRLDGDIAKDGARGRSRSRMWVLTTGIRQLVARIS